MPRKYLLDHVEELFGEGRCDRQGRASHRHGGDDLECPARVGRGPRFAPGMALDEVPALVTPRTLVMVVEEILTTCPGNLPELRQGRLETR